MEPPRNERGSKSNKLCLRQFFLKSNLDYYIVCVCVCAFVLCICVCVCFYYKLSRMTWSNSKSLNFFLFSPIFNEILVNQKCYANQNR